MRVPQNRYFLFIYFITDISYVCQNISPGLKSLTRADSVRRMSPIWFRGYKKAVREAVWSPSDFWKWRKNSSNAKSNKERQIELLNYFIFLWNDLLNTFLGASKGKLSHNTSCNREMSLTEIQHVPFSSKMSPRKSNSLNTPLLDFICKKNLFLLFLKSYNPLFNVFNTIK